MEISLNPDNWKFEERIYATSAFAYMDGDQMKTFKESYRAAFPGDPSGKHFNENVGIMEWDE